MIINSSKTDPNKLLPMQYPWAWEYYKTGIANNWVPEEVPMQNDVEQWKSDKLTEEERRMIIWNLGFFSTAESLTANNLVLSVYKHITDPACRMYLLRQAFEEAIHSQMFVYICDTLGFDPDDIYNMYMDIPSIKEKDDFVVGITKSILDPNFTTEGDENIRKLMYDLVGYYVIMEGIFFYAGFAMILGLRRLGKMEGIGQQFEFTMRDESVHLAYGCDLIQTIRKENPGVWTPEFEAEIRANILKAVELEKAYVKDACPSPTLGMNATQFNQYVEYITDRRLHRLDMPKEFNTENPFPWLSQATDLAKEKNFFETTVTEYQSGSMLDWDDE
jgi:ribonucleoside-diphosphate reductase beta chain